jgi:hypothetical protein
VVAGASEGLGAAFAEALATRGLNVILLARRAELLTSLAEGLRARHSVEVHTAAIDLGAPDMLAAVQIAVDQREVGLVVYNAALAPVGTFVDAPLDALLRAVDVNVRAPLQLARTFLPAMVQRKRGGLVLMSSLAGQQGAPRLATYAATKAFNIVLGESLWSELRAHHVDVVTSIAGAIRTPGYVSASKGDAPGTLDPHDVVERTLAGLGHGPVVIPGAVNGLASIVMRRLLPRGLAVTLMGKNTGDLGA